MTRKYYLDTCIWRDFLEDRKGFKGENLGKFTFDLILLINSKKQKIVLSDFLLDELRLNYSLEQISSFLVPFKKITETIKVSVEEKEEAKLIAFKKKIPKGDALHAIIARNHKLILISRDKHFKKLHDISICFKPEEII